MRTLGEVYSDIFVNIFAKHKTLGAIAPPMKGLLDDQLEFVDMLDSRFVNTPDKSILDLLFYGLLYDLLTKKGELFMHYTKLGQVHRKALADHVVDENNRHVFCLVWIHAFIMLRTVQATVILNYLKHTDYGRGLTKMLADETKELLQKSPFLKSIILSSETSEYITPTFYELVEALASAENFIATTITIEKGPINLSQTKLPLLVQDILMGVGFLPELPLKGGSKSSMLLSSFKEQVVLIKRLKLERICCNDIDLQPHYNPAAIASALDSMAQEFLGSIGQGDKPKRKRGGRRKVSKVVQRPIAEAAPSSELLTEVDDKVEQQPQAATPAPLKLCSKPSKVATTDAGVEKKSCFN